jgi:uncharacterized membrane protein YoaK (UPF0700 family)
MIAADDESIFAPRRALGFVLLTGTAGFVNAGALAACESFITHVTGSITSLGSSQSLTATPALLIASSFVLGAMMAVLIAETMKSKSPIAGVTLPLLASVLVLFTVALAGKAGMFGPFGSTGGGENSRPPLLMLGPLAAAMGMVNASIAVATANKVRITHLTGPATDLAGNIIRAVLNRGAGSRAELRWAVLRFSKLVAFAIGAMFAAKCAPHLQYDTFAAAAGILIVAVGFATSSPSPASKIEAEETKD